MDKWLLIAAALALCAAVGLVLWQRRRTARLMDRIERMLRAAMDGSFAEESFDESRLSRLETELAHYLSASVVSSAHVAEERDKIKELISDISHQTKTPIANLLLYSELLEDSELTEEQRGNVDAIHHQTEKLRFLIDALVKLSRLENGILELSPCKEALEPVLRGVLEQFAPKAAAKGLTLRMEPLELKAVCDPKWTAEAIGNLVDNAIKYTRSGGVTISGRAYELFARIDVADTGGGIPEAEQAKIFSRFYRSEANRDSDGVGVGLYLSREIVTQEGGYIKLSSSPGKGSVFSVFLPRG